MLFDAGLIVLDRDRVKGEEGGSWNDGPLTYDTACRSSNRTSFLRRGSASGLDIRLVLTGWRGRWPPVGVLH